MKIFISGGAKNGKSFYAQTRAKELSTEFSLPLYYVATMIPKDEEDQARIRRHLSEREGWGFNTIEKPTNLSEILAEKKPGVFLVDSVTAILSNVMFPYEAGNFGFDPGAADIVKEDLIRFSDETSHVVFVSDYIYSDPAPMKNDDMTEVYRRGLADVDRALARASDQVIEISAGIPIIHK